MTESTAPQEPHTAPAQGALSHIRVLEVSRVFAGPWAGQMLADLGADWLGAVTC